MRLILFTYALRKFGPRICCGAIVRVCVRVAGVADAHGYGCQRKINVVMISTPLRSRFNSLLVFRKQRLDFIVGGGGGGRVDVCVLSVANKKRASD